MTRNLKVLGLALAAMLAMSAFAAAAQAHEFTADTEGPVVITGSNEEGTEDVFKSGAEAEVKCATAEFEATAPTNEEDTLTVTPRYGGTSGPTDCVAFGEPATVDINHCAYVFDSDTDGNEHADVDLECAEGEEITITVPTLATTVHIPAQSDMTGGVHYTDKSGDVTVDATVTGIDYTCTGLGAFLCGDGKDGTYDGEDIVEGFEDAGDPLEGTETTTPHGLTEEGEPVDISAENNL